MKNSAYLIVILALALVLVIYNRVSSAKTRPEPAETVNTTIQDIMTRASVRSYSDRKVTDQQVDTLLRAAMAAPTAADKRPWRFVVINNHETLKKIATDFSSMTMADGAALAVVMCGDMTATFDGEGREYWVQDVSAASENLLLAAHAMGLGAVWCGIYPKTDRVSQFSEMLQLPENIIPMACICVGYPAGETTPKDKWNPENVHYNTWGGK